MIIYVVLGAIVVGLSLGVFGSGGSILTVPVLVYLLQHPEKVAIAESLGIVGAIALVGSAPSIYERLVSWRLAALFGVPGMLGTFAGAWIATFVAGYVQLLVFALVMAFAAVAMWQRAHALPAANPADARTPQRPAPLAAVATQGTGVGLLTGFVGVGGGFLIVPALVLVGRLSMRRAVATSLVIITLNAATGLLKHHHVLTDAKATPHVGVMLIFIAVGIIGSFVGRALQGRLNQRVLQRGFAVFLIAMAAVIALKESLSIFIN